MFATSQVKFDAAKKRANDILSKYPDSIDPLILSVAKLLNSIDDVAPLWSCQGHTPKQDAYVDVVVTEKGLEFLKAYMESLRAHLPTPWLSGCDINWRQGDNDSHIAYRLYICCPGGASEDLRPVRIAQWEHAIMWAKAWYLDEELEEIMDMRNEITRLGINASMATLVKFRGNNISKAKGTIKNTVMPFVVQPVIHAMIKQNTDKLIHRINCNEGSFSILVREVQPAVPATPTDYWFKPTDGILMHQLYIREATSSIKKNILITIGDCSDEELYAMGLDEIRTMAVECI